MCRTTLPALFVKDVWAPQGLNHWHCQHAVIVLHLSCTTNYEVHLPISAPSVLLRTHLATDQLPQTTTAVFTAGIEG